MISEIAPVLEKLRGTEEYDILVEMDAVYSRIETKQREWFEKSKFTCPKGCGTCCEHFEPDLLESEALYMAAWLISNQPDTISVMLGENQHSKNVGLLRSLPSSVRSCASELARESHLTKVSRETFADREQRESLLSHCRGPECSARSAPTHDDERSVPTDGENSVPTCPFYRSDLEGGKYPGHCSIYGGRASICRLFGAAGSRDKYGKEVWKPCKYYPAKELAAIKTLSGEPILHRQYTAEEVQNLFGCLPPVMSDMMEQEETFTPDDDSSVLLHDILPKYIQRILWIMDLNAGEDSKLLTNLEDEPI